MKRTLLWKVVLIFSLMFFTLACGLVVPTETATPAPKGNDPLPLPDTSTPRWVMYERALASVLLGSVGNTTPDLVNDSGPCEWEIWGQNGNDVYVWAECITPDTGTSSPAIIRLSADGTISEVIMPAQGWENIRDLFPEDVLTRIFNNDFDAATASDHIYLRWEDPSIPPQIVLDGVNLP